MAAATGIVVKDADPSGWIAPDVLGYEIPPSAQQQAARFVVDILASVADRAEITVSSPPVWLDVFGMIVPRTRLNIRWKAERPSVGRILAGIGAAVAVDPHHGPKTAAASVAVIFLAQLRRLSDEQLEAMLLLQRLTRGSIYRQGVSIHDLRRSWPSDSGSTIDEVVDDLTGADVLYRRGDHVTARF